LENLWPAVGPRQVSGIGSNRADLAPWNRPIMHFWDSEKGLFLEPWQEQSGITYRTPGASRPLDNELGSTIRLPFCAKKISFLQFLA